MIWMYVVLVYDICFDEKGQKVLRKVFKICKKYLSHIQNSVFEGELSSSQLFRLRQEIDRHIRDDKDSVIIFKSRHEKWLDKELWGLKDDLTSNFL